jgi:hypothetical protein
MIAVTATFFIPEEAIHPENPNRLQWSKDIINDVILEGLIGLEEINFDINTAEEIK